MRPVIDFKISGTSFYFDVKCRFTKLCDDSGVGKSFLYKALEKTLESYNNISKYPVIDKITNEKIQVVLIDGLTTTKEEALNKIKTENALIMIDEADIIFNEHKELANIVIENNTSNFILIARSELKGLDFSYNEHALINSDKNKINVEYYS